MTGIQQILTSETHSEHVAFWKSAFAKIGGDFQLRPHQRAYAFPPHGRIEREFALPAEAEALVARLSSGYDLAEFVVVASAAFQLLGLYSGSPMVYVESPLLHGEPGSIPLIAEIGADGTVSEYLDAMRGLIADSYTYQDFPVEDAVRQWTKGRAYPTTNLSIRQDGLHGDFSDPERFDFAIRVHRNSGLRIHVSANAAVFPEYYVKHFGRHLGNLLAAYQELDQPFAEVTPIDEAERSCYLKEYAGRRTPRPDATIAELFEQRAAQSSEQTAIRNDSTQVSYDALNRRANRLAHFLRGEYGLQTGDVVGVVSDASEFWITAVLAVLKAGCVYLPIDPEYPEERIQFLVEDAGVRVLLIHSEQLANLSSLYATPMFALDLQLDTLETPETNPEHGAGTSDAAYIIYTSGSTGKPKGVILEHRSFVNMALHHIEAFGIGAADRFSQFYSASFDSSLFELFVPLLAGGTVVTTSRAMVKDPAQFSEYVYKHGVTAITAPPMYLAALDRGKLGSVKRIVSAGDNAKVEDARDFAKAVDYYNSYGPTEAAVCVTHHRVDAEAPYAARIPLGRAIDNTVIYLLDEKLRLVPEGCIGEICISGAGVARGYLNRPDLTEAAFMHDPFREGERLYRTGDLGVWLPGGELELIGRKDTQVKIRGYRVELGEIDAVLSQHPRVREAVAVAVENQPGEKRLAAYVTANGDVTAADLRAYLKERVPEFMTPSAFVILDRMPLTANGKIDRKALPPLEEARAGDSAYDAPQTETQERIARIWAEVLGIERVGIHRNFFELGGDSIQIIQAVARANRAGLKLSAQQFFEHQTIAELATVAVNASAVQAEQGPVTGTAPLTSIQHWFFSQGLAEPDHFNQSVMLEVPDDLEPETVRQAVEHLLAHHDALRLRFNATGGRWEQRHEGPGTEVPFTWSETGDDTAIEAEAAEVQRSLNIGRGPLIRVHLFRCPAGASSLLLVAVHHMAIDGVSWRILLEDLHRACEQIAEGRAVILPPKTTSFQHWASRLQEFAHTEFKGLSHWRRRVEGTGVPSDRESTPEENTVGSAAEVRCSLDAELTDGLLHEAPRAFNTRIDDILLTALLLAFREWTGRSTLVVDMEGHGREDLFPDVDLSRTVGWFTTLYPVALHAEEGSSPEETLKAVKEQLREIPLRGLGYGVLRYLRGDADFIGLAGADVLFNYLGQTDRALAAGDGWKPVLGLNGPEQSPKNRRSHVLEINGIVSGGELAMTWTYSRKIHDDSTIQRIARRYNEILRGLVDACRKTGAASFTPSDFPAARLDQKSLDALIAHVSE